MNEDIDNAIVAAIKGGNVQFAAIKASTGNQLNRVFDERMIDKRLQSLRRRKVVEYAGTPRSWRVIG